MMGYAPIKRTCSRCGKKGDTTNINSCVMFNVKDSVIKTVSMKSWKDYCEPCEEEIESKLSLYLKDFEVN